MSSLRFLHHLLGSAVLAVMAGLSVNYLVDPYSVFGTRYLPEYGQLQERYLKIEHLKSHPDFNTFLLGSSRIGVIRTEDADRYFPGAKTYNLTMAGANQWDVEQHVEWLVKHIPGLTHVIVQIDWFWGYGPDRPAVALLEEAHPDISGRSRYGFLFDYLTLFNAEAFKAKIMNNRGGPDQLRYEMAKGYWSRPLRDRKIEANCGEYVANEKGFGPTGGRPAKLEPAILDNNLASIARYKSLLDRKNIRLTVLLTPQNRRKLDSMDIEDYEIFITRLAQLTDFRNFMYYNRLTRNDCNYYEASHYRPHVGELVIRSLAEPPHKQSEVSHYVSKESAASHVEFLKANFFLERTAGAR